MVRIVCPSSSQPITQENTDLKLAYTLTCQFNPPASHRSIFLCLAVSMEGDPQTRISSARSFWGAVDCAATGSTVPSRPVAGSNAKPAAAKTVAVSAPAPVPEPTFMYAKLLDHYSVTEL
jgi:hypothetical protein